MDTRLLQLVVCPICKGELQHDRDAHLLICHADRLGYPVKDGIPFLLESEAVPLPGETQPPPDAPPLAAA